jgi:hypothetical protein
MADPAELWVIWSFEHDAWWAPRRMGYVSDLALAGRYTHEEALVIEAQANLGGRRHEHALLLEDAEAYGPPLP